MGRRSVRVFGRNAYHAGPRVRAPFVSGAGGSRVGDVVGVGPHGVPVDTGSSSVPTPPTRSGGVVGPFPHPGTVHPLFEKVSVQQARGVRRNSPVAHTRQPPPTPGLCCPHVDDRIPDLWKRMSSPPSGPVARNAPDFSLFSSNTRPVGSVRSLGYPPTPDPGVLRLNPTSRRSGGDILSETRRTGLNTTLDPVPRSPWGLLTPTRVRPVPRTFVYSTPASRTKRLPSPSAQDVGREEVSGGRPRLPSHRIRNVGSSDLTQSRGNKRRSLYPHGNSPTRFLRDDCNRVGPGRKRRRHP